MAKICSNCEGTGSSGKFEVCSKCQGAGEIYMD